MEWSDQGIILSARPHGESSVIVETLTRGHGRHAGLVRGGASRRMRGTLEPGNEVAVRWSARLAEHLGNFTIELTRPRAAEMISDPLCLAGLSAVCALAQMTLPEREPHASVFDGLLVLLDAMGATEFWPALLVRWELGLLDELGFGLDLSKCAATGGLDDLVYVSPRTGRAVSREAGATYHDRLLPLPAFLLGTQAGPAAAVNIEQGLDLTGFFLSRHVLEPHGRKMPPARYRFRDRLKKQLGRGNK